MKLSITLALLICCLSSCTYVAHREYRNARLGRVIEDIQPFSSRQIVLADRRIARAHVTVWMDSQYADLFVRNLSMFLRVVVDDSNPRLFTIRCGEPNCANLAYPVQ